MINSVKTKDEIWFCDMENQLCSCYMTTYKTLSLLRICSIERWDDIIATSIDNHLDVLVHKPLIYIGRASNMLMVGFGKAYNVRDVNGNTVHKSQFDLHVQSSWRINNRQKKDIIVASSDFYSPCSLMKWSNEFE